MPKFAHLARRTVLAVPLGAVAATLALTTAPDATATDGSVFTFPRLGAGGGADGRPGG